MALRWQAFCFDTPDPDRIATFWAEALGWRRTYDSPDEVVLEPPEGSADDGVCPDILFLRVPEPKTVKNRLHIDLRPDDDRDAEVARLEALGAKKIDIGQGQQTWVVMADPDGNEFCVLRVLSAAELAS
jgi:catechol 2,3-dioxygenase-like lactoylglutathione lyase family enzyme